MNRWIDNLTARVNIYIVKAILRTLSHSAATFRSERADGVLYPAFSEAAQFLANAEMRRAAPLTARARFNIACQIGREWM
jgi:hypothetical protein